MGKGNLHSTMFLLIQNPGIFFPFNQSSFTFHNVSINTSDRTDIEDRCSKFTFHNVSINTVIPPE